MDAAPRPPIIRPDDISLPSTRTIDLTWLVEQSARQRVDPSAPISEGTSGP